MKTFLYIKKKIEIWLLDNISYSRDYSSETRWKANLAIEKVFNFLNWVFIFIYVIFGFYWSSAVFAFFILIKFLTRNIINKKPSYSKAINIQAIIIFILISSRLYNYSKEINFFYIIYTLLCPLIFTRKDLRLLILFTLQSSILYFIQSLIDARHCIQFNQLIPNAESTYHYLVIFNLFVYVYTFVLLNIILNKYYGNALKKARRNFNIPDKSDQNQDAEIKDMSNEISSSFNATLYVINNFLNKIKKDENINKAIYYISLLKKSSKLSDKHSEDLNKYIYILNLKCVLHQVDLKKLIDKVSYKLLVKYDYAKIMNEIEISVIIKSHEELLEIIIENLIENGIEYNLSEIPIIRIFYESQDSSLSIYFKDNGIGIQEDNKENIFDPFIRLNKIETPLRSGLGLTIARLAALKINADLSLISGTDGCIFRLKTPDTFK